MKRLHAIVSGRVQGVGFRYFVKNAALESKLSGWVRNLPDGTVELEVEGPDEDVEEFREKLWKGPGFSRIDNINEDTLVPTGNNQGFSIKY